MYIGLVRGFAQARAGRPQDEVVDEIFRTVLAHYPVGRKDLEGHSKFPHFTYPRKILMWLLYQGWFKDKESAHKNIGKLLSCRDRRGVSYAIQRVSDRMRTDADYCQEVAELCVELHI